MEGTTGSVPSFDREPKGTRPVTRAMKGYKSTSISSEPVSSKESKEYVQRRKTVVCRRRSVVVRGSMSRVRKRSGLKSVLGDSRSVPDL